MAPFRRFLDFLERQDEEYWSIIYSGPLKDHFLSIKHGVGLLKSFYLTSERRDIYLRFETMVADVSGELESLSNRAIDGSLILDMDRAYTNLREKIKNVLINPDTGEHDAILWPEEIDDTDFSWFFDHLLNGFVDLLSCKDDQIAPSIKEKLLFLQTFFTYVSDRYLHLKGSREYIYLHLKGSREFRAAFLALIDKTTCFLYLCFIGKMDEEMELDMKLNPSNPLEMNFVKEAYIMIFRASTTLDSPENLLKSELSLLHSLIMILESKTSSQIYLNDQSFKLHDKLNFLENLLKDLSHEVIVEKFIYLVRPSTEAIICRIIPILYSWYEEDMKEEMALEVIGAVFEVLDQIEHIQSELRVMKLYNYPKTDELGFLDLLLEHLEELLKCRPELIEVLKSQIETLNLEFDFLRSFLRKIKKQHNEHEELEDLWTSIIGLAYQTEYIIDFFLLNDDPEDSRIKFSLSKIIEQTKLIKTKIKRIYDEEKYHMQTHDITKAFNHFHSKAIGTTTNELVVGFEDEEETVMQYLVGGSTQREVISIIGMPGLGKTTLAKKLYEAPSIIKHFDIRAWCSVSQTYQKKELLLTILGNVVGDTHGINDLNEEELAKELYQRLKICRYLIVLDDIWDIEAWNDLVRSFPDDKIQSRILITSRLESVASQIKAGSKVHFLRQFSDAESWELFQKKLFPEERFPQEFLDVGKEIAKSCKRLPLAIVVVAGLLTKLEKNIHMWEQIARSLSSHIFSDSENQCKAILELSYIHLPDHLKSCFLYIGAFREDESIIVSKLKWFWIAEGFVRNTMGKSLDDVAEEYFKDLISRSLVTAIEERSQGGIKICRVHDLLRNFCLEKANEEKFLLVAVSNSDTWDDLSAVYVQRRISFLCSVLKFEWEKASSYSLRSLFGCPRELSFISQNFRLLRVLHIDSTMSENFGGIEFLIHLRYLFLSSGINFIPSSIANLWNLQFLLLKMKYNSFDFWDEVANVPDSLWDMVNLRHVHINDSASFNVHSRRLEKPSLLDNLETLSTPCFSCKEDAENLLRRLPKLRKLRCVFSDCWEDSADCYQFPVLDFLDQLTSLKMLFKGSVHLEKRCEFKFPSNLQKLTLSNSGILWDDISRIGFILPNLKVLKLIGNNSSDSTWNVNDEDFPQLKCLKLSNLEYLRNWSASVESFPKLEQLVLDDCTDLDEIPPRFEDIPTLRKIVVSGCKSSLNDSARRIQEEQLDGWQNQELKVYISPSFLATSDSFTADINHWEQDDESTQSS